MIRADIAATDRTLVLGAIGRIRVHGSEDELWERYLDLFFDGLT